ncbi:hypothetical protein N307_03485, partial [Dryobates pubescens]
AAIDFLLLAQGHGCEDVDGMCCFNLSDHGELVHAKLDWLEKHSVKIQKEDNMIDSWLRSM